MANALDSAKTPLLLIGGGGHCAAVIDVVESTGSYEIVGIVEAPGAECKELMGYPVVGIDEDLESLIQQTPNCLITVGQMKTAGLRKKLYDRVLALGGHLPVIVSPLARVARQTEIGAGSVVMHFALVNSLAKIGHNCIINNYASIEHGVSIGAHCHLSTRSTVNGDCHIGHSCFLGSSATVLQGRSIVPDTVIGAATLVTQDITHAGIYVGAPAKQSLGNRPEGS
ncbi:MAG: acetyltransferase [Thiomicrorhabdus chilensis]|uniref:acetyltransferase n=1 Tax=Thiomicrorhabdus chilensis TaxID=63656 RepID=UPI00299E8C3D|nr:acetyltransferase [Thiomicrorhabdus chilensis]MDX1346904.1 acetyltransferase [Thiomicrorhabdus chilensis]